MDTAKVATELKALAEELGGKSRRADDEDRYGDDIAKIEDLVGDSAKAMIEAEDAAAHAKSIADRLVDSMRHYEPKPSSARFAAAKALATLIEDLDRHAGGSPIQDVLRAIAALKRR